MPSPESLFRHALYGQRFFRQEFNKTSRDIYLPDCFGFGFALPSIAAHSGLNSFSTQKLTWGRPIPLRRRALDRVSTAARSWPRSIPRTTPRRSAERPTSPPTPPGRTSSRPLGDGSSVAFRYVGTGDTGGGPTEESVRNLVKAMTKPAGWREGREHLSRPARPRPDARAGRSAARTQGRAAAEDPRHRLLHVPGGDEEIQSRE